MTSLLKSIPGLEGNNEVDVKDNEIVESVKESDLTSEIENVYEDTKNYTGSTPDEAFTALESAMQWYEH